MESETLEVKSTQYMIRDEYTKYKTRLCFRKEFNFHNEILDRRYVVNRRKVKIKVLIYFCLPSADIFKGTWIL